MGRETQHYVFRDIDEGLSIGLSEPENKVIDIVFSSPEFVFDSVIEGVMMPDVLDVIDPEKLGGYRKASYWEKGFDDDGNLEYGLNVKGEDTCIEATKQDFLDAYDRPHELYDHMSREDLDPERFERDLLDRFAEPIEMQDGIPDRGYLEGRIDSGDLQYLETGERSVVLEGPTGYPPGEEVRVYGDLRPEGFEGRQDGVFYLDVWQIEPV